MSNAFNGLESMFVQSDRQLTCRCQKTRETGGSILLWSVHNQEVTQQKARIFMRGPFQSGR